MKKRVQAVLLIIMLLITNGLTVMAKDDIAQKSNCYTVTPQLTEATYHYLTEVYIEKYPLLGLDYTYGSGADKKVLQTLADIIVTECTTEEEKANEIVAWVKRNINYNSYTNETYFFPIDVFYNRCGNCVGYALLISQLMRLEGIPAVMCTGFRGNMKENLTLENLYDFVGHAWVCTYYDGEWHLFDPLYDVYDCTDRDYIAQWYFTDYIEGVSPCYESMDFSLLRGGNTNYYIDGRFMNYSNGLPSSQYFGHSATSAGTVGPICFQVLDRYNSSTTMDGYHYLDNPERREKMINDECYTDGWISYCDMIYFCAKQNGILYCYTLKSRDNITYYFDGGGWAWELEGTEEDYTLTHGCLTVTKGNTLKIIPTQCKTENGVIATWEAMNPDIATVTEDGEIIGLKEGAAMFMVYDARGGQSIIQVYVSERERIPEYQDRPIDQEHPTPVPEPITPPSSQPTDAPVPTFAPEIVEQVEGFTGRMYEIALGRDAENQGINDWTNRLLSHEVDGAGIAQGFIMSEEFTGKELSDEEYVETLYQTFFDRPADEEGKNTWLGILAEGKTRESVLAGFVNSGEFDTLCDSFGIVRGIMREDGTTVNPGIRLFTERLYNKVLDREGEKAGLEDWTGWIAFGDYSAEDAAKLFFDSDEFIDRGLSDADYVETLYQTFMGRDSDPDGRSFWLEQLAGGMSRTEVLEGFSRSTEFGNILQSFGL